MSVLKSKRSTSKAEYVNLANEISVETVAFLTRLSARYARLLAEPVAALAGEVIDQTEKANSIFPKGEPNMGLRKGHLLEARAALMALDVRLGHCYTILALNPQGCFTKPDGKSIPAAGSHFRDMAAETGRPLPPPGARKDPANRRPAHQRQTDPQNPDQGSAGAALRPQHDI